MAGTISLTCNRPEDIFGSLEVDGEGKFVGENGNYQPSGMPNYFVPLYIIIPKLLNLPRANG